MIQGIHMEESNPYTVDTPDTLFALHNSHVMKSAQIVIYNEEVKCDIYNEILFYHKEQNYIIFRKMSGIRNRLLSEMSQKEK